MIKLLIQLGTNANTKHHSEKFFELKKHEDK